MEGLGVGQEKQVVKERQKVSRHGADFTRLRHLEVSVRETLEFLQMSSLRHRRLCLRQSVFVAVYHRTSSIRARECDVT